MKFAVIFQDDPDFLEIIKEIRAEREDNSDVALISHNCCE